MFLKEVLYMFEEESRRPPKSCDDKDCCIADQTQLLKVEYEVVFCVDIEECNIVEVFCLGEDEI